jgi:hypothetical protein
MDENKNSDFTVGYKKPPRHSQFKLGRSGNPAGRPKKKIPTIYEEIAKELNTKIRVVEGKEPRLISKLEAIVKQHINKAVNGDLKAIALIMRALEPKESEQSNNLSPVLQALRAIHAKHEAVIFDENRAIEDSGSAADTEDTQRDEHNDPA